MLQLFACTYNNLTAGPVSLVLSDDFQYCGDICVGDHACPCHMFEKFNLTGFHGVAGIPGLCPHPGVGSGWCVLAT